MFTFTKEERLCGEKLISMLFNNGSSFLLYPFRVMWIVVEAGSPSPAKVLISVPKRKFKRAVDRNLLKRRIREAYRLNKEAHFYSFLLENNINVLLSLAYIGKEINDYSLIDKKLKLVFGKFKGVYHESVLGKGN